MSENRRAVLGFEHPDGRVGFCCTSAPLVYLRNLHAGIWHSQFLGADAELRWVLRTDTHDDGVLLRDQLNHSERAEAISEAERLGASESTVLALHALSLQHASAITAGDRTAGNASAWELLETSS